jgi:hypothetical protein
MTFRAAAVVPPIVLFADPKFIKTPSETFATATVPVTSVPMKLPCTRLPERVPPMEIPGPLLPEMRLRAPGAVPPIVWLEEFPDCPSVTTPVPFPMARVPAALVPMKLPCTRLPVVPALMEMPVLSLPEMTLRAAEVVPPIILFELAMFSPRKALPRSTVPVTSVPM